MQPICAVAFDMDGLMFNTEDIYWMVGDQLMKRRGHEYTDDLCNAIMGRPPRECFETMIRWYSLEDTWEAMAVESEELFISLLDEHLKPMPGLVELLEALEKAGIPKAICTSSSRNVLVAIIERMGWSDRFVFTMTAEDITRGKPDPQIYQLAAERFGIATEKMAALEDSETGSKSAAASGAFTIAVPGDHSRHQDFSIAAITVEGLKDPRLYEALGLAAH